MKLVFIFAFSVFLVVNPSEAIPDCLPELAKYLHGQEFMMHSLMSDLEHLKHELQLAANGQWPDGQYCILASGDCPAGFTRHEGFMRALSQYSYNTNFITPATFGDSKIQCHGDSCGQYHPWNGELYITACCK